MTCPFRDKGAHFTVSLMVLDVIVHDFVLIRELLHFVIQCCSLVQMLFLSLFTTINVSLEI